MLIAIKKINRTINALKNLPRLRFLIAITLQKQKIVLAKIQHSWTHRHWNGGYHVPVFIQRLPVPRSRPGTNWDRLQPMYLAGACSRVQDTF
jgi:hypothetical protein